MKSVGFGLLFLYLALLQCFLGALAALCFHALVKPAWLAPLLPPLRRLLGLRRLLPVLFLFLLLFVKQIYPWAERGVEGPPFRVAYLSLTGFILRAILYWALWLWLARAAERGRPWAGGPGLVLLVLSLSFAAVDWVASLDPEFGSTIFGLVFFLSSLLLAFAWAGWSAGRNPSAAALQDQGSVHLSLLCTWTYLVFMQYLVVWSGNLPKEVHWFAARGHGWAVIPAYLALGQFFLPFLALLQTGWKRSATVSRILFASSIVGQLLFLAWQVFPAAPWALSTAFPAALAVLLALAIPYRYGRRKLAAE